tara:strand:- start:425381 stop:426298 length:918 start_codon:yes stop_codon:yes gene_type:complete
MRILDLLTPAELSRVASLQLFARGVVEGFCSGHHRSPHKGYSVEFKEHRPYVVGDELRNIDWKVFGKSDRLYIREFEEETNLRCHLLVDQSGSMAYTGERSQGISKYEYATRLAASLSFLMLGQQDAVGCITFDDQLRDHVPLRSRPSHMKAILTALASHASRHETDLGTVFTQVAPKLGRRGLLVILTDAMGDVDSIGRALAQFRVARHEVILFQVLDRDEMDFPFTQRTRFRDLENSSNEQTVNSRTIRQTYLDRFAQHAESLSAVCRKNRVDLVQVVTDQPYADAIHEYLAFRKSVLRRRSR